jgi:membrane fusion protein, multidrug efflux system
MRPTHCAVQLSDLRRIRAGLVWLAEPSGVRVHLTPDEADGLVPGGTVELVSDEAPLGPLRATALVTAIEPGHDDRGRPLSSTALTFIDLSDAQRQLLTERLMAVRPLVLAYGVDAAALTLGEDVRVSQGASCDEVTEQVAHDDVAVLLLGPGVSPTTSRDLIRNIHARHPGARSAVVAIGVGTDAAIFQECVDAGQVFYLSRGVPDAAAVRSLVRAAVNQFWARCADPPLSVDGTQMAPEVLEYCERLAWQESTGSTVRVLVDAVQTLLGADCVRYLTHDASTEALSATEAVDRPASDSTASGLVGYAARTGERVVLDRVGTDPRFDVDADCPGGHEEDRFLVEPLTDSRGTVIGLLIVTRDRRKPQFSQADVATVGVLARYAISPMTVASQRQEVAAAVVERSGVTTPGLYRQEALDSHNEGWVEEGAILQVAPRWVARAHWLTGVLLLALALYAVFATVDEYAAGPALIRARQKFTLTMVETGMVRSVAAVGSRVRRGDMLVRLDDRAGATTIERFAGQLWSPGDGILNDVRVRPGQHVAAGEYVGSIIDESAGYEVIAFMPGHHAAQMRPGMPLMLKMQGYPDAAQSVRVERVGAEVVGAPEALRYAGRESASALGLTGPVTIVTARLPGRTFAVGERRLDYRDGLIGHAEVVVRSDPIVVSFFPALKRMFGR